MRTVDAHHHYWEAAAQRGFLNSSGSAMLERNFGPEHLNAEVQTAGVDKTVLVQSADEPAENDRLARYAANGSIAGVVGWLPLQSRAVAWAELSRMELPKLCGVRCSVAGDPLVSLDDAESVALLRELAARQLAWDVVPVTNDQMQAVIRVAHAVPELTIVIDHLGRPPADTLGWEPWASNVRKLAMCPNVAMKLSVGIDLLTSWTHWDPPSLEPYVEWAFEYFGPQRLMLASNWPVVLFQAGYCQAWSDLGALAGKHVSDSAEYDAVRGGAAMHWYRLQS